MQASFVVQCVVCNKIDEKLGEMILECKICGSKNVTIIYDDFIRNGAVGKLTDKPYQMYQCLECKTIWHTLEAGQNKEYYESEQYREELESKSATEDYFSLHDKEVLEKLEYTGTDIYRNKIVMDIGAGGGSFLDFVYLVAKQTIAIEPSKIYRNDMSERGHIVYPYAKDAIADGKKADIIVSFDVIEHVDSPKEFMNEVYELLSDKGVAYIGTPTDAPVLRTMLGHSYEQFLFSYQHPWVLSTDSFEMIGREAGFDNIEIRQAQRYGLANAFTWLHEQRPMGHNQLDFIPRSLEDHYKRTCEELKQADYMICVAKKS